MRRLIGAALIALPLVLSAAIYKSVDKKGNAVYSDQPDSTATEVNLGPVQSYQQSAVAPKPAETTQSNAPEKPKAIQYTKLEIVSPATNGTFWLGDGAIAVNAVIEPGLQMGDEAVLLYDGQAMSPITDPATDLTFSLAEYNPGKHTLSVAVRHAGSDKILKTSNSVTFYVLVHRNNQN